MFSQKNFVFFIISVLFLGSLIVLNKNNEVNAVVLANKTYSVEIADTNTERQRGLSLHTPLLENQGMLFVFNQDDFHGFWMKDMLFPIDILWIDSNLKVVHIEKHVSPETFPKVFYPTSKSRYVLEISSGQVDKSNIKIGELVKFLKK